MSCQQNEYKNIFLFFGRAHKYTDSMAFLEIVNVYTQIYIYIGMYGKGIKHNS